MDGQIVWSRAKRSLEGNFSQKCDIPKQLVSHKQEIIVLKDGNELIVSIGYFKGII